MIHLETEALIPAPPDGVWRALTDFAHYPAWNPLMLEVTGEVKLGAKVGMKVRSPDGSGKSYGFNARIVRFEPGHALEWTGGVPGLLSGHHYFRLSPADGGTRLVHGEDFFGVLAMLMRQRILGFRPAYEGLNQALAERVKATG